MTGLKTAVTGIYPTQSSLEGGVRALKEAGFRNTDISVIYPEHPGAGESGHPRGEAAPEGAATGASTGAVVGGILGWLAGVGSLAIPGVGLFIAAGPILAALVGASAGGALGGVAGGLAGLGVPEHEASGYQKRLKEGDTLLSIHSDNEYWAKRAREILETTGAVDISSQEEEAADHDMNDHQVQRSA